jgi:hypothetical protein
MWANYRKKVMTGLGEAHGHKSDLQALSGRIYFYDSNHYSNQKCFGKKISFCLQVRGNQVILILRLVTKISWNGSITQTIRNRQ